jgi:hypothetical protein
MKHTLMLFLAITLIPSAIAQQQYRENIYVFSLNPSSQVPAIEECVTALDKLATRRNIHDINPTFGSRFKINSVDTSGRHGKVINNAVEEIGEILICQDGQTYPTEMNLTPVYYEISIGNRTFKVEGGGTSPNFPDTPTLPGGGSQFTPPGFPVPGENRAVSNFNGSVLPAIPGRVGGAYMESALTGDSGEFDDGLRFNTIHVLRVLLPVRE